MDDSGVAHADPQKVRHDNYSAIKLEQSSFMHATDQVRARVAAKRDGYIGAWSDWFNVEGAARDGGDGIALRD